MSDRKSHEIIPADVAAGDIMAFTYFVKVVSNYNSGESLVVEDVDRPGKRMRIDGTDLIAVSKSADQSHETISVSKTAAAEILVQSYGRPIAVAFIKADGSQRVMRCRLIRPEPLLGRSMVEDLEADVKNRVRQVDHRTIEWLVVDGTRYEVK